MDVYTLIPNFKKLLPEFLNKENLFAVVGPTDEPTDLGFQTFKSLKEAKYDVVVVYPDSKKGAKEKVYKDLAQIPKTPDVVCIVTQPDKSLEIAKECLKLNITKIWIEPGSEKTETIDFCKRYYIDTVYQRSLARELLTPPDLKKRYHGPDY